MALSGMGVSPYRSISDHGKQGATIAAQKEDFMRKRFLSLLCVLALCLGLLPTTAGGFRGG